MANRHLLEILITGNSRGAIAAFDSVDAAAKRTFGSATTGLQKYESMALRTGAVAAGFAAVAGAGLFQVGKQAAQLEQRVAATGAIFKDAQKPIEDFVKTSSQSAGLSESDARLHTARIGAMLQNYGFAVDEAANKSVELTKLGADLALRFGQPVEEAVNAVVATLRGERDPIEKFGVALKEADVAARVAALGLDTSTAAAISHAKAVAVLSLVEEQTASSVGAFADAQDTAAGKMAVFAAEMQNLKAKLGAGVLPILSGLTDAVSGAAEAFNALPDGTQSAIGGILASATAATAAVGAFGLLSGAVIKTRAVMLTMGPAATAGAVATAGFATAMATFGVMSAMAGSQARGAAADVEALTEEIVAFNKTGETGPEMERSVGAGAEDIKKMIDLADELNQSGGWLSTVDRAGTAFKQFGEDLNSSGSVQRLQDIDSALSGLVAEGKTAAAMQWFEELADANREAGGSINDLYRYLPDFIGALEDLADAEREAAGYANVHATALANLESALSTERARIDAAQGFERVNKAVEKLNDLREEAAKAGRGESDEARKAADAQRKVSDAIRSRADAVERLRDAQQELAQFNSAEEGRIRGLEREQILRRRITTAAEARDKEIDLYRFDQRVAEQSERLNDDVVDSQRAVEDASRRVGDAHEDVAEAARDRAEKERNYAREIEAAQLDIDAAVLSVIEDYQEAGEKLGYNTAQAELYRKELEKIKFITGSMSISELVSGAVVSAVTVAIINELTRATGKTVGELFGNAPPPTIPLTVGTSGGGVGGGGGGSWGRAGGGPVAGGGVYLVGEKGPELFVPGASGTIVPNQSMGRYGSHMSIVQNNSFVGGDVPTVSQLDAQNRKLGIRIALSGRRG